MPILYEDRLIRQSFNSKMKVYTVRKRLPASATPIEREIQQWLKDSNGQSIVIIAKLKEKYNYSLREAFNIFKSAAGINSLLDRHQGNYHKKQNIRG